MWDLLGLSTGSSHNCFNNTQFLVSMFILKMVSFYINFTYKCYCHALQHLVSVLHMNLNILGWS